MKKTALNASLTTRIFIGMLAGIVIGAALQLLFDDSGDFRFSLFGIEFSTYSLLVEGIFSTLGQLFITSLKMLVVPLVLASLVCGTASLSDPSKLGRLGAKSLSLYILTTAIAVSLAIFVSTLVNPGAGVSLPTTSSYSVSSAPSLGEVFLGMFPSNPFESMAQGNMLQVIVFAVLIGIAMALSGDAGQRLRNLFEDFNTVIMKLVTIIMNIAPYGVFVLMAKLFAGIGADMLGSLAKYFIVVLGLLLVHGCVTYSLLLKIAGLNPIIMFKKMRDAALFAFSTSSSSATLPVTMETARNKLGVGNSVASFTIPLGATINMDGTAIMQGVATVFIAQVYGVDLSLSDYLLVILTATLASVGTAGVPGVGLIMLAMVLQQVNLPVEGIALIIGVDRLLDMMRTAVNITGDCTVACIVAKSEGELSQLTYDDPNAGKAEETLTFPHS